MQLLQIKFKEILILSVLSCTIIRQSPTTDINSEIYYCYIDPKIEELLLFAVAEEDTKISREILENILQVRPNCIDVYKSILFISALENNTLEFQKLDTKIKTMETDYKLRTGKMIPEKDNKESFQKKNSVQIYKNPPPKKDRINDPPAKSQEIVD